MHRRIAGCATRLVTSTLAVSTLAVSTLAIGTLRTSTAAAEADVCGGSGAPEVHVSLAAVPQPERLQRSICEWFESEPWRVRFVDGGHGAPGRALSVVVVLRGPHDAELSFDDGSSARERRELTLPGGLDETGLEIIAQVIHSSAEAHAERATRPPATEVDESPASAPRATAHTEAPLALGLGAGFHGYARGPEPTTFGPSMSIELGWQLGDVRAGVYARGALWTSNGKRSSELEISLRGATAQGGVSLQSPLGALVTRAALGAGADFSDVDVSVRAADEARRLPFSSQPRPFIGGELGVRRRIWQLDVGAAALLRWQLLASHYQVRDEDGPRTILRPWRLQPGALIEVGHSW